eukprot:2454183-Lingulodinium_polyedra.AAC.1
MSQAGFLQPQKVHASRNPANILTKYQVRSSETTMTLDMVRRARSMHTTQPLLQRPGTLS